MSFFGTAPAPPAPAPAKKAVSVSAKVSRLSAEEAAELSRCVQVVKSGLVAFVEAGKALKTIRDKQLYRQGFESFEAWSEHELNLSGRRVLQIIESAETYENLKFVSTVTPKYEAQVRPLAGLTPVDQVEAWSEAVAAAAPAEPSGVEVKAAADKRRKNKRRSSKIAKPVRLKVPGGIVMVTPNKAYGGLVPTLAEALKKAMEAEKAASSTETGVSKAA